MFLTLARVRTFITGQCKNVFFRYFQVVKLLLRYGGDPCQSNRRGETPLKVANSPTMLNLLLGKGTYTSSEESLSGMRYYISRSHENGAVYLK